METLKIINSILTENDCFKSGRIIKPRGIVVHSTGANNPNLSRYCVNEDELGTPSPNHWNKSRPNGRQVCVHAFIGYDKNKEIQIAQTLPFNMRCWGCGKGTRGSYNNSYIQFEICESYLDDAEYFNAVYKKSIDFCVYLCRQFNISPENIVCHSEAHKQGYASNHADVMHWFPKHNKNMDIFREDVKNKLENNSKPQNIQTIPSPQSQTQAGTKADTPFRVKVLCDLNIRKGASTDTKIVGVIKDNGVYTITKVQGHWGKLKSGKGWISILNKYVKRLY